jgi:NAD(P)-dependent dehydrogenase (short-subunit alcohol dehydrogenase family)
MPEFASYPSLREKVAFVTGGATGIGASIVEHFAAQGSRVAFFDMDVPAGKALAADLTARGHARPHFFQVDLRDIDGLRARLGEARNQVGDPYVLVNNAARDDRHAIEDVTPEFWDERMAVNLRHQFFATQAVIDGMKRMGGGSIVNMGSISWRLGSGGMPAYVTAKAAVEGLTRGLARDLGQFNIRVNCVVPGWVMTERQIKLWLTPEAEQDLMVQQCLKKRLMPEDVARMVMWLAAEDGGMATSQAFVVDAGWL